MKHIGYYILYAVLWLVSLLPLRLLYLFSDFCYVVVYYVVRYRVKVTRTNLLNAFPDKSDAERLAIERRFYRHLCDYAFETLRMMHMDEHEIGRHIVFENTALLEHYAAEGRNVFAVFGHYGNWEWVCSLPLHLHGMSVSTLYKTLKNSAMDRFFIHLRSRYGTHCYARKQVLRGIVELKRLGKPFVMAFIADQTPSPGNAHYWTTWLRQDTPFLTGWEQIARKQNEPVVFLAVKKVKRGHYICRLEPLCDNPQTTPPNALVEKYARRMEQNIDENPAWWLWSHKRWKYQRPNICR